MYPSEMATAAMQQLERDAAAAQRVAMAQRKERKSAPEQQPTFIQRVLHLGLPRSRTASTN
jgi:hypothetical protein